VSYTPRDDPDGVPVAARHAETIAALAALGVDVRAVYGASACSFTFVTWD
jgi:hypothetical protein